LEDELASKRADETYYFTNRQTISTEINRREFLQINLNQLKMLRRLVRDRLTSRENEMLLMDEKFLQSEIDASLRMIVMGQYLQAKDPPPGKDPNDMLSSKTDEQLLVMIKEFQDSSWQYVKNLKVEMLFLMSQVSFWKKLHSFVLIISIIILIIANILIYASMESE
jgi:hypothetical protein